MYADQGLCDSERERSWCGQGKEDYFEVRVDERAVAGRANKRLLEILAEHFKVQKSRISIVRGTRSRNKIVQVILVRTADSPAHG
jgi:uncharacterized protein YggU (UPF0235/DUF167 family)